MSSETFELVYDGPALRNHQMDVRDLIPALQGVGSLIRDANAIVNRGNAQVQVLVNSEHKPGCFSISLDVVQELLAAAKGILGLEGVKTAKDILEWLQLIGVPGLVGYYQWKKGRKTTKVETVEDHSIDGSVRVHVEGDNNTTIVVPRPVFELGNEPKIAKDVQRLLKPLSNPGIDKLLTKVDGQIRLEVTKEGASDAELTCESVIKEETILSQNTIQAHLRPYDAQFDADAKSWSFWYGDRHIPIDISETPIAKDAVERRQVSMDDVYRVDLQVTEKRLPSGNIKVEYKVLQVHERFAGASQTDLFDEEPPEAATEAE